jgi:polar amino acid transport system substrate-binding protein
MNMRRYLVYTLLALGLSAAYADPVKVLTEDDPPFNMPNVNGGISGVSTEMVREMFRRAALPYTLTLMPWIRAYNIALRDPSACLYSTTRNAAREKAFRWIGPLLSNPWALYAGPHSPRGVQSLRDIRPYVIGGYFGDAIAQYLMDRGFVVQRIGNDARNVRLLELGRIDFWATGVYHASYLLTHLKLTDIHQVLQFNNATLYLACNPQLPDVTVKRLSNALSAMQNDGTVERIRRHY